MTGSTGSTRSTVNRVNGVNRVNEVNMVDWRLPEQTGGQAHANALVVNDEALDAEVKLAKKRFSQF